MIKAEPIEVQSKPVVPVAAAVEMTAEEYKAMIELAKNAPDDCEMCGSKLESE
jgi:ribonucleoside-diphosphate reductase alpha chain